MDIPSATPGAVQRNWRTECAFPACPPAELSATLDRYAAALHPGSVFSRNRFGEQVTELVGRNEHSLAIIVRLQGDAVKPWALSRVIVEDGVYVHEAIGTFFTRDGAVNLFNTTLGIDAPHVETIDDYS